MIKDFLPAESQDSKCLARGGQLEATSPAVRDGLLLAVAVLEQSNPKGLFPKNFTGGQV